MIVLNGYNTLPGKKFYKDSSLDGANSKNGVEDSMRRDYFISNMFFIHCTTNNEINMINTVQKQKQVKEL